MRHLLAMALVLGTFSFAEAQDDEDFASQVEEICCGAGCCLISGGCFTSGEENPSNSCEVCDPGRSQATFTNTCDTGGGGTDAGGGGGGDGGGCQAAGTSGGLGMLALLGFAFIRRRQ